MSGHLELALDGLGWHPAAWRLAGDDAGRVSDPRYWVELAQRAEAGLLDAITIEDTFGPPGGDRVDRVRDRLDAVLVASRVAPLTRHIGLFPTIISTHTEPFHHSKAISTLDHVSGGRAGVRVRVSASAEDAALVGRRPAPAVEDLLREADDYVEVLRRLWDSWEDDAEIRDVATGRFIDRDKLHYIDFEGAWFSVKGPSIVPRSPQGQPLVSVLAHAPTVHELAARVADVVHVTPTDREDATAITEQVREAEQRVGRSGPPLRVIGDLAVAIGATQSVADARVATLDELAGEPFGSDAHVHVGTPETLADLFEDWAAAGLDGLRLRPLSNAHDVPNVVDALVPTLQARGSFRTEYEDTNLRARYGLARPVSRYAVGEGA